MLGFLVYSDFSGQGKGVFKLLLGRVPQVPGVHISMGGVAGQAQVLRAVEVDVLDVDLLKGLRGETQGIIIGRGHGGPSQSVGIKDVGGGEGKFRQNGLEKLSPLQHLNLIVVKLIRLGAPSPQRQGQGTVFTHGDGARIGKVVVRAELELLLRRRPGQGVPCRGMPLVPQVGQAQFLKAIRPGLHIGAVYGGDVRLILPIQGEALLQPAICHLQDNVAGCAVIGGAVVQFQYQTLVLCCGEKRGGESGPGDAQVRTPAQRFPAAQSDLQNSLAAIGVVNAAGGDHRTVIFAAAAVQIDPFAEYHAGVLLQRLLVGGEKDAAGVGGIQKLGQGENGRLLAGGGLNGNRLALRVEGEGDQLPAGPLQPQQICRRLGELLGADGAVGPTLKDGERPLRITAEKLQLSVTVQVQVEYLSAVFRQGESCSVGQSKLVAVLLPIVVGNGMGDGTAVPQQVFKGDGLRSGLGEGKFRSGGGLAFLLAPLIPQGRVEGLELLRGNEGSGVGGQGVIAVPGALRSKLKGIARGPETRCPGP